MVGLKMACWWAEGTRAVQRAEGREEGQRAERQTATPGVRPERQVRGTSHSGCWTRLALFLNEYLLVDGDVNLFR